MLSFSRLCWQTAAVCGSLALSLLPCSAVLAQQASANTDEKALVQLNFPREIEIQALVDYVSERLDVKILYDEEIANKKISVKASGEIPAESLLQLLQSALRIKGLALVDAGAPGWKKIVNTAKLAEVAQTGDAQQVIASAGGGIPVTQVFRIEHADSQKLDQLIKPFLTQPGANSFVLKEQGVLIVTDFAANLLKLSRVIDMIDQPQPEAVTKFVKLQYTEASAISAQLTTLLAARLQTAAGTPGSPSSGIQVAHDDRTNQLILVGREADVNDLLEVVNELDIPLDFKTKVYPVANVPAERIQELVGRILGDGVDHRNYRSVIEREENLYVATASAQLHQKIESLVKQLDVPIEKSRSPVRFYKLKHVTAVELLETLRAIETGKQSSVPAAMHGRIRLQPNQRLPGPNQPPTGPAEPLEPLPRPPSVREEADDEPASLGRADEPGLELSGTLAQAQVTADSNTNSLIIVAPPSVQKVYDELINSLDQPRPQVMIEAKVVVLDTSDNFSLGVEISGGDRAGKKRVFGFSSFGLSDVDPANGALTIRPGLGFNGVLLDPDIADVVIRALSEHSRAKVISAPRILVSDNATGKLSSVAEVPFTSVNASQTVATTSFAGFAQAGTTISVTPRIGDDDRLQLDYQVTMNAFTGSGSAGVPPPRQTDEISSQVTIPDGHTIIVGGLNRKNVSDEIEAIPFLESIPLVRKLVSSQINLSQENSLFVFLRPVILRDDQFRSLKFLSGRELQSAGEPQDFPQSRPLLIQ